MKAPISACKIHVDGDALAIHLVEPFPEKKKDTNMNSYPILSSHLQSNSPNSRSNSLSAFPGISSAHKRYTPSSSQGRRGSNALQFILASSRTRALDDPAIQPQQQHRRRKRPVKTHFLDSSPRGVYSLCLLLLRAGQPAQRVRLVFCAAPFAWTVSRNAARNNPGTPVRCLF